MKKFLLLVLLVSNVSFAEIINANTVANLNKAATPSQGGGVTVGDCPTCTNLETIKKGCKDPGSVHHQIPPSDIKIFCTERACKWGLGTPVSTRKEDVSLSCGRITSSKSDMCTGVECTPISSTFINIPVPTLEEKCGVLNTTYGLTCDQVIAMKSVGDFCKNAVAADLSSMPEVMEMKLTGRTQGFKMEEVKGEITPAYIPVQK